MNRCFRQSVFFTFFGSILSTLGASTPMIDTFVLGDLGFWSSDGRRFSISSNQESLRNSYINSVMVSFKPGSSFASSLKKNPSSVAYYSSLNSGVGRALLVGLSDVERDQLAARAHQDIGICGAIERFLVTTPQTPLADAASPTLPTSVRSVEVEALLTEVSAIKIQETTKALEALGTRHHNSNPQSAPSFLEALWQPLLPVGATITRITHEGTPQQSLVVRIPGSGDDEKTVILGAHLDSINFANQSNAPGADDDASGIAALTEVLRSLKTAEATFARPIEIHAYAAEEVGLLGSQDIVSSTSSSSKQVASMLQLDMIGYNANRDDRTIHIINTDTSPVLVRHLKDLISNYLDGAWKVSSLSSGTSDHRSWHARGFHSIFAFENPENYNRNLHTEADRSEILNFDFAAQFTKLALVFVAHEAGLTSALNSASVSWSNQQTTADAVKMAISRSKSGGLRISAAVPKSLNAQSAELCKVANGQEKGCQSLVTTAAFGKSQFDRMFFISSSDLAIQSGDFWRFHFYSATGGLVAVRTVKLSKD